MSKYLNLLSAFYSLINAYFFFIFSIYSSLLMIFRGFAYSDGFWLWFWLFNCFWTPDGDTNSKTGILIDYSGSE